MKRKFPLSSSRLAGALLLQLALVVVFSSAGLAQTQKKDKKKKVMPTGTPVLWRGHGDIPKLDLTYGSGSAAMAPVAPFTFIREEKQGASPKFRVKDAQGTTWTVKLGVEAQAETVATRIVWAMGYYTEESYYLDRFQVNSLPRLSRGQEFVESGNIVRGAKFEPKRKGVTRGEYWDWLKNPFLNSRELDGLKVLMVLLANYDTRLENNHILYQKDETTGQMQARYVVTDIGATLGRVGGLGGKRVKNSLEDFKDTKFIVAIQNGVVEFDYSTKPKGAGKFASLFSPGYGKSQANKEKAMRHIPVANAKWMGGLLSQLTEDQLNDIFRAANYDEATRKGFVKVLRERIGRLADL
ncbi:MAG TPA: hypothetical protein VJT71_08405 [Pyrinomonadaceae bacterium]|nr:hypothetical protein [Pyrinomonadaceae bacterium]